MSHKAFCFDWTAFELELPATLREALSTDEPTALVEFVGQNLTLLVDPYEGEPLEEEWLEELENGDTQELADFALTKFYCPTDDQGVGDSWPELEADLGQPHAAALLGVPFGPPEALLDPGGMGAYFQSPALCRQSLEQLREYPDERLVGFLSLLENSVARAKGVYVTF